MTDKYEPVGNQRIVVSGAFGTGTTTLSNLLSESLCLPVIEDKVRNYFSNSFNSLNRINNNPHKKLKRWDKLCLLIRNGLLLGANYSERVFMERIHNSFISDEGSISELTFATVIGSHYIKSELIKDAYKYLEDKLNGSSKGKHDIIISKTCDIFEHAHISHAKRRYNTTFYAPIEIPIENDGFRPDSDIQKKCADHIINIYRRENIQYKPVTGNPESRLEQCLKYLYDHGKIRNKSK